MQNTRSIAKYSVFKTTPPLVILAGLLFLLDLFIFDVEHRSEFIDQYADQTAFYLAN